MKKKSKLLNRSILLVLGIVYLFITILAVYLYVSYLNKTSTTPVSFMTIVSSVWWQLIMLVFFGITYFIYTRKEKLGAIFEIIMGNSMLVYLLVSVVMMGTNALAILIELVYPAILIIHGTVVYISLKKKKE